MQIPNFSAGGGNIFTWCHLNLGFIFDFFFPFEAGWQRGFIQKIVIQILQWFPAIHISEKGFSVRYNLSLHTFALCHLRNMIRCHCC